ncbi:MAG: hypothetical protein DIU78_018340 [Pseudomonadota bacterium]|nr:MAG: hypothetical protein DIU78_26330 [Pseudomonadota bacterium]
MSRNASPVTGYNNNVRHRGCIFHIQTEDSGIKNPRIVTHLFADGGRIIHTLRTDYREHVDAPNLVEIVRRLMKAQHKAAYLALRRGELDAAIEAACGPFPTAVGATPGAQASMPPDLSSVPAPADVDGPPVTMSPEPLATIIPIDAERAPAPRRSSTKPPAPGQSERPPRSGKRKSQRPPRDSQGPATQRPAARVGAGSPHRSDRMLAIRPSARSGVLMGAPGASLFGDAAPADESLQAAIRSYIGDDND